MTNRSVVITGASAGVGLATALEFAKHGDKVAVIARGSQRLSAAKTAIDAAGGQGLALAADVADAKALDDAASQAEEQHGPIDVWVNCAMVTVFSRFWDIEPEEFARATEVTYLGCVYGTMAALKRMRPRDKGTIVQVGSALAYRSIPLQSAYCGAKHAIVGFTDSLRTELINDRSNIKLSVVHLPSVNTPQFTWARSHMDRHPQPVAPIFQPEVAAQAIHWASENPRREYMVGSPTSMAVLGEKVSPRVGDVFLAAEGFSGQMCDLPYSKDRPDNLFTPVDIEVGSHGPFDFKAKGQSWQQRIAMRVPTPAVVQVAAGMWSGAMKLPQIIKSEREYGGSNNHVEQ